MFEMYHLKHRFTITLSCNDVFIGGASLKSSFRLIFSQTRVQTNHEMPHRHRLQNPYYSGRFKHYNVYFNTSDWMTKLLFSLKKERKAIDILYFIS